MAHFAKLNGDNIVDYIIVINNEVILDENGQEQESLGVEFCKSIYGEDTKWIQTSYNGSFRGRLAKPGYIWDGEKFVAPVVEEK